MTKISTVHSFLFTRLVPCLVLIVLVLGTSSLANAQKNKKGKVPPGNPFQALQRQIDELRERLGLVEDGDFEELRVENTLFFGDGTECTVGLDPLREVAGLLLRDPGGIRVLDPSEADAPTIFWGPTDDCSIGLDPVLSGLVESDPVGFRLLGPGGQGCRLIFGPTLDCTVEVDPQGPPGLLLRDPAGIRVLNPEDANASRLFWGPTDECSIGLDPQLSGLVERDPVGFRLLGPDGQGCRLIFGPTLDCTVEVDPQGPPGLLLRDPAGIRILNPSPGESPALLFGPEDLCRIRAGEIGVDEQGIELEGLILEDPGAVAVRSPDPNGRSTLVFGDNPACQISVAPGDGFGMIFTDPERFLFDNTIDVIGDLNVSGVVREGVASSSRRWKQNIRTMHDALDKVNQLRGVYFNWKEDRGGKADIGFIAEEVAEVLPEATTFEKDGTTPKGVKYANLVALAVEGVKAQQTEIDRLQHENDTLRDKYASLESKMAALTATVEQLASQNAE